MNHDEINFGYIVFAVSVGLLPLARSRGGAQCSTGALAPESAPG